MTTSVVKALLSKAKGAKSGGDAMHFTQAAINAAQALNLAGIPDDIPAPTTDLMVAAEELKRQGFIVQPGRACVANPSDQP